MISKSDILLLNNERDSWVLHAESHRLFKVKTILNDLSDDQSSKTSSSPEVDLDHVCSDLETLFQSGYLSNYNRERLRRALPTDGANLALNINLTAFCNLGCSYCFAEGGDYGRIKGKLRKDVDVDAILAFIDSHTETGDAVRFEFFGGEPLMNFETIEALCEGSVALAARKSITFLYRISTNLTTRLSPRELALFERFGFIVSVSIDGGETTHDRNRPNKAGRGSFQAILANCRKVRAQSDRITMVARMTYVPLPNSSLLADVEQLHALDIFDWFQILPATVSEELVEAVFGEVYDGWSYADISRVCADKVDREYAALGDAYLGLFRPDNRFRGILEIESIIRMILEGEVANGHCSGGRNYFTFSPDQSIMPCHRLVGEADFQAGSFAEGIDTRTLADWRRNINDTPVCSDCSIRYICSGGCKQENVVGAGDLLRPDPQKCRFQFRLVHMATQAIIEGNDEFRHRRRDALQNMFVSCGRPVLKIDRQDTVPIDDLEYLEPVF